ncbi:MAG: BPL-N domain-containing protein [Desulfovibrionaceae bacterium]
MSSTYVYWDESHFWGLMAVRALREWGVPHRLVRGIEIAQGLLADNPPALLLVPGGRARGKAARLGEAGREAVRRYVGSGGRYLGFCGGAGLALTGGGLGLCPWTRKPFENRLQHFLSGHIHATLDMGSDLVPGSLGEGALLPVWWPGQFNPGEAPGGAVRTLAAFGAPGPDFWVADLALSSLPEGTMADWEAEYGIRIRPDFLRGHPGVIHGTYGEGEYVLSYAHLETPASPQANAWLAHLLGRFLGMAPPGGPLTAWNLAERPVRWEDPALLAARAALKGLIATGRDQLLLFWRTPWLLGWRRGIPGASINALYALVCELLAREPSGAALAFWEERAEGFARGMGILAPGARGLLLAERLAMTVLHSEADAVPGLAERRELLFGPAPMGGGVHGELLAALEDLYAL